MLLSPPAETALNSGRPAFDKGLFMPLPRSESAPADGPLVDAEWSREWGCWVVSSMYRGAWTLVGLFRDSGPAFKAASSASVNLRESPDELQAVAD